MKVLSVAGGIISLEIKAILTKFLKKWQYFRINIVNPHVNIKNEKADK